VSDDAQQPKVRVRGGSGPLQTLVEFACLRALEALDYPLSLQVTIKREPTRDDDAGARINDDGSLFVNLGLAKHGEPLLGWVISEEIAHHWFATQYGIRVHGEFVEVLLHELFATWFQIRENILTERMSFDELITAPVPHGPPTAALGEHLGKQIAGAALGSERNGEFLGEYLVEPGADEVVTQFTRILLDTVPFKGTPREVAQSLRDIYDEIIAEQAAMSDEEPPPAGDG
jgi:hypothetical protein